MSPINKFLFQFYNDYGDIIKATLSKAREINKVATAKTLAGSLMQVSEKLELFHWVTNTLDQSVKSN